MTKQERARKIKVGDLLSPLKSRRGFLPDKSYRVIEVIEEGTRGAYPLFEVEDTNGLRETLTYKFFQI